MPDLYHDSTMSIEDRIAAPLSTPRSHFPGGSAFCEGHGIKDAVNVYCTCQGTAG
jgi:hypothetical protein